MPTRHVVGTRAHMYHGRTPAQPCTQRHGLVLHVYAHVHVPRLAAPWYLCALFYTRRSSCRPCTALSLSRSRTLDSQPPHLAGALPSWPPPQQVTHGRHLLAHLRQVPRYSPASVPRQPRALRATFTPSHAALPVPTEQVPGCAVAAGGGTHAVGAVGAVGAWGHGARPARPARPAVVHACMHAYIHHTHRGAAAAKAQSGAAGPKLAVLLPLSRFAPPHLHLDPP